MEDLKPCPFCGGKAELVYIIHGELCSVHHICDYFGSKVLFMRSKLFNNKEEAIKAWNMRSEN